MDTISDCDGFFNFFNGWRDEIFCFKIWAALLVLEAAHVFRAYNPCVSRCFGPWAMGPQIAWGYVFVRHSDSR